MLRVDAKAVLMSGDVKPTAERVAPEAGRDQVFAEVNREDQAAHANELQSCSCRPVYTRLGCSLRPEVSALLMSVSSIIVALNAVSLRRAKI